VTTYRRRTTSVPCEGGAAGQETERWQQRRDKFWVSEAARCFYRVGNARHVADKATLYHLVVRSSPSGQTSRSSSTTSLFSSFIDRSILATAVFNCYESHYIIRFFSFRDCSSFLCVLLIISVQVFVFALCGELWGARDSFSWILASGVFYPRQPKQNNHRARRESLLVETADIRLNQCRRKTRL
jgi:hypothetical protein